MTAAPTLADLLAPPRLEERLRRLHALLETYLDLVVDGPFEERAAKAACELALYAGQLARWAPGVDAPWRARLVERLAPRLRSIETLQRLLWLPAHAGAYGLCHALLARAGHGDARWHRVLRRLFALPATETREAAPYERLEENWCRSLVGADAAPTRDATPRRVHPLFMAEPDAYAFTHAILYETNLGERELGARAAPLADAVDAGVVWSLARGDFDLLGEFLLCAALIGEPPGPGARVGLAAWAATWDTVGWIPDVAADAPCTGDRRGDVFFGIYHANLVGGLVAACLIDRTRWLDGTDPPRWPRRAGPGAAAVAWLSDAAGEPAAAAASRYARDALDDVAGDLAIHLGMHRRDLALITTGLTIAGNRSAPSSTWCNAVEWLGAFDACLAELDLYQRSGGTGLAADVQRALERAGASLRAWRS